MLGVPKGLRTQRGQEAGPPCVPVISEQRPDRERAQQGLRCLSPDSPWVWPLCHFAATGVFEPDPGVLDVSRLDCVSEDVLGGCLCYSVEGK